MISLLGISILGNIFIQKKKIKFLNESIFAILVGLLAGLFFSKSSENKYINNITTGYVKVFIIFLLPPIIFESSYNIKKKELMKNIGTILLYAILGTIISIIFIGYFMYYFGMKNYYMKFTMQESFAYGALISATDPVCILSAFKEYTTDTNFFLLVFGESILNDAVSMVCFDTLIDIKDGNHTLVSLLRPLFSFLWILAGSSFIGYSVGFVFSYGLKTISSFENKMNRIEIGFLITLPWLTYLITQISGMSGILAIFFLGISSSIYAKPFISKNSRRFVHNFYVEISAKAEIVVFIFIGIAFFSEQPYDKINLNMPIILIILCLIGRLLNIGICSYLANITRSENNYIDLKKQFFLWFAGVRGAMAFALAIKSKFDLPRVGEIFLLLTLIITGFTSIYSAFFLEYTLHKCDVIVKNERQMTLIDKKSEKKVNFNNIDEKDDYDNGKEGIVHHSFLHENIDDLDEEYKDMKYVTKNSRSKNIFVNLKNKIVEFNENYLMHYIQREERKSIQSSICDGGLGIEFRNIKKDFLNQNNL